MNDLVGLVMEAAAIELLHVDALSPAMLKGTDEMTRPASER
jgi:hypothetical protein